MGVIVGGAIKLDRVMRDLDGWTLADMLALSTELDRRLGRENAVDSDDVAIMRASAAGAYGAGLDEAKKQRDQYKSQRDGWRLAAENYTPMRILKAQNDRNTRLQTGQKATPKLVKADNNNLTIHLDPARPGLLIDCFIYVLDGTDLKTMYLPEMEQYPLDIETLQGDLRGNFHAFFTRGPLLNEIRGPSIDGITTEEMQDVLCKLAFFANHEHGRDPQAYATAFDTFFEGSIMPNTTLDRLDARNRFHQVVDQTFKKMAESSRGPGDLPKRKRGRPSTADKTKTEWEMG